MLVRLIKTVDQKAARLLHGIPVVLDPNTGFVQSIYQQKKPMRSNPLFA